MPTNNHAVIRYRVLDKCLQRKTEDNTEEHLRKLCGNAISEFDPNYEAAEVSLRTFRLDIAYLKRAATAIDPDVEIISRLGSSRYYYFYSKPGFSIYKNELTSSEVGQFSCAMQLLGRFKGLPEYDGIAELGSKLKKKYGIIAGEKAYDEYEHVESVGEEAMPEICNDIINQQPIRILYSPFGKPDVQWIIHPYFLKEYNNRWFLFGYNEEESKISNLALDRIRDIEPVSNRFIPNTFVQFDSYFNNIIGVTIEDKPVVKIVLKATGKRFPYIETKKLHASQKYEDFNDKTISISVIPNKELDALILSFGADLEIISPEWYRDHIKAKACSLYQVYFGGQEDCTPEPNLCDVNQGSTNIF